MSHFKLFVVGADVESLLDPYDENDRSEFVDQTDEVTEEWDLYQQAQKDEGKPSEYDSMASFAGDYFGYEEQDGKFGYYANPNAKWDWWEVGGRYSDYLINKCGVEGNSFQVKDIDFEAMQARNVVSAGESWEAAQKENEAFRNFIYGITPGMTKEQYIASRTNVSAFAFLMGDKWVERGEMGWFGIVTDEKESSDWETQMTAFIKALDPEETLTVVDCHI